MTEISRTVLVGKIEELKEKIASGDYVKESDWHYVPDYGMVRSVIPDGEQLEILKSMLNDDTGWVYKA